MPFVAVSVVQRSSSVVARVSRALSLQPTRLPLQKEIATRADEISDALLLSVADQRGCKPGSWKYRHGRAFPG